MAKAHFVFECCRRVRFFGRRVLGRRRFWRHDGDRSHIEYDFEQQRECQLHEREQQQRWLAIREHLVSERQRRHHG